MNIKVQYFYIYYYIGGSNKLFRASVLFLLLKCELVTVLIGNLEPLFVSHRIYLMINGIDANSCFLEGERGFVFPTVHSSPVSLKHAGLMQSPVAAV